MQGPIMTHKTSASCSPPPTTNTLQATGNRQGRDRCLLVSCLPTHTHAPVHQDKTPQGVPQVQPSTSLGSVCTKTCTRVYTHTQAHACMPAHTHKLLPQPWLLPPPTQARASLCSALNHHLGPALAGTQGSPSSCHEAAGRGRKGGVQTGKAASALQPSLKARKASSLLRVVFSSLPSQGNG